jgi:TetR/AcrR family transcriptional regulator, repressor for uid operon
MDPADRLDENTVRILDAARVCFTAHGVRRTTMNEIARVAGVGVATAYRRFPRKPALVRAVILREAEHVTALVAREMNRPGEVADQSADGFTAFAHALSERPLLVQMMRGQPAEATVVGVGSDLLDLVMAMARDAVAAWLRGYQAHGRFLSLDPEVIGEIYARLALSLVLTPDGVIPMHDDDATRAFAKQYLVPLLGVSALEAR